MACVEGGVAVMSRYLYITSAFPLLLFMWKAHIQWVFLMEKMTNLTFLQLSQTWRVPFLLLTMWRLPLNPVGALTLTSD